jgi:hypothetical protein
MSRVDPSRLLRALALEAECIGTESYRVTGGHHAHRVQLMGAAVSLPREDTP